MKTHTCYWIEPFAVFRRATRYKDWTSIIGILFMIINFATLGVLKVLGALYLAKNNEMKFKLKLCRNFFGLLSKTIGDMWLSKFDGFEF